MRQQTLRRPTRSGLSSMTLIGFLMISLVNAVVYFVQWNRAAEHVSARQCRINLMDIAQAQLEYVMNSGVCAKELNQLLGPPGGLKTPRQCPLDGKPYEMTVTNRSKERSVSCSFKIWCPNAAAHTKDGSDLKDYSQSIQSTGGCG